MKKRLKKKEIIIGLIQRKLKRYEKTYKYRTGLKRWIGTKRKNLRKWKTNRFKENWAIKRMFRTYYGISSNNIYLKGEIIQFLKRMEKRLDVILVRMNLANTIKESRQYIGYGKVIVNGERVKIKGLEIKKGDIIWVMEKASKGKNERSKLIYPQTPVYLEVNPQIRIGIKIREPNFKEIENVYITSQFTKIRRRHLS